LIRPGQSTGDAIAIPAIVEPKGTRVFATESKRPMQRVGDDKSYSAEIGAAWANKDGRGFRLKLTLLEGDQHAPNLHLTDASFAVERGLGG
jgi:hypothetical protein